MRELTVLIKADLYFWCRTSHYTIQSSVPHSGLGKPKLISYFNKYNVPVLYN